MNITTQLMPEQPRPEARAKMKQRDPADRGLALLRIGLGIDFLLAAWNKTRNHWLSSGTPLARTLAHALPSAQGSYQPFLREVVLPHAGLFARLVTVGEWTTGTLLLLGLLTRLGAVTGIVLVANYALMKGIWSTNSASERFFILCFIVFLITSAGLVWGLDGLLQRSLRRFPLARWLFGAASVKPRLETARSRSPRE